MSKASEWVRSVSVPPYISFENTAIGLKGLLGNYSVRAEVTIHGCLGFTLLDEKTKSEQFVLEPAAALVLGHWILDTFGDEPRR